jgi:hypothetical protein
VAQAGWSPVLFRVMGHNAFIVRYIYYIFNSLWTTFNHLFIWLDPEVVAHDALSDEGGLFKFSFWIARAIFFFGWMEFI